MSERETWVVRNELGAVVEACNTRGDAWYKAWRTDPYGDGPPYLPYDDFIGVKTRKGWTCVQLMTLQGAAAHLLDEARRRFQNLKPTSDGLVIQQLYTELYCVVAEAEGPR